MARVAADPARVPEAAEPGGWRGLIYYRLHGSPKMYYSAYSEEYLDALAARLRARRRRGGRSGASSTTPRSAPPRATRWISAPAWGTAQASPARFVGCR